MLVAINVVEFAVTKLAVSAVVDVMKMDPMFAVAAFIRVVTLRFVMSADDPTLRVAILAVSEPRVDTFPVVTFD